MVNQIAAAPFEGRPTSLSFPDGKYIYMTVRPPQDSTEKEAWISRVNLSDWSVRRS
jgi:hypothetical protein